MKENYVKKKKNGNQKKKAEYAKAPEIHFGPTLEYKMSKASAKFLLSNRKGPDAKMSENDFLCKVVNDECGLLGYCVRVIIS